MSKLESIRSATAAAELSYQTPSVSFDWVFLRQHPKRKLYLRSRSSLELFKRPLSNSNLASVS